MEGIGVKPVLLLLLLLVACLLWLELLLEASLLRLEGLRGLAEAGGLGLELLRVAVLLLGLLLLLLGRWLEGCPLRN